MAVKLVYIDKIGMTGNVYAVRDFTPPVDPGYGIPGIGGHPDNTLPGSGHIDNTLPGGPGHPDNRPPGKPPTINPGETLVLYRDPEGVWHYATLPSGSPPPKPVPVPPPTTPDNTLPPTATPKK